MTPAYPADDDPAEPAAPSAGLPLALAGVALLAAFAWACGRLAMPYS